MFSHEHNNFLRLLYDTQDIKHLEEQRALISQVINEINIVLDKSTDNTVTQTMTLELNKCYKLLVNCSVYLAKLVSENNI